MQRNRGLECLNLNQLLSLESPELVCLVETWIDDLIPDSDVICGMPYTVIIRSDHNQGKHGGVLLAAHDSFLQTVTFVNGVLSNRYLQHSLVLEYLQNQLQKIVVSMSTISLRRRLERLKSRNL